MRAVHSRLLKAFDAAAGGYRYQLYQVFDAFLDEALHRFGLPQFAVRPEHAELRSEVAGVADAYMAAVGVSDRFSDVLGPVYMEISSRGQQKWMGQFFTPWEVAQLMAAVTLGDCSVEPTGRMVSVLEPACGAGVTTLAALDHIARVQGIDELRRWSFTLVDLDRSCARMAAIQMLAQVEAHGAVMGELIVWRGDSLRATHDELIVHAVAPALTAAPARLSA